MSQELEGYVRTLLLSADIKARLDMTALEKSGFRFRLTYRDDDDDVITVCNDMEVCVCVCVCVCLRLSVYVCV